MKEPAPGLVTLLLRRSAALVGAYLFGFSRVMLFEPSFSMTVLVTSTGIKLPSGARFLTILRIILRFDRDCN